MALTALLASPSASAARPPDPGEAKLCVTKADAKLLAGVWNGMGHLCSEYFEIVEVQVTDTSRVGNTADVMLALKYKVLAPVLAADAGMPASPASAGTIQLCTGAKIASGAAMPGAIVVRIDRKVSMQEWASGWRCKD